MTSFISHSFHNKAEFENVVDQLAQVDVPYWNPAEIKPGSSLRDQLRNAIEQCSVCIFVATHQSLESSWCGVEVGAFWGARKPIIVYIADSSLKEEDLPPIVQGDVWERRISRVAARAKEIVAEARVMSAKVERSSVANMSVEQLERLIVGAVSLVAASEQGRSATSEEVKQTAHGAATRFIQGIRAAEPTASRLIDDWRRRILWVDDQPDNNAHERCAFESMGIDFELAPSTKTALDILSRERFAAIISDMGRQEGAREGYVLLEAVRASGKKTPFFIYTNSNTVNHEEADELGAQGVTNRAQELFQMVLQALAEGE